MSLRLIFDPEDGSVTSLNSANLRISCRAALPSKADIRQLLSWSRNCQLFRNIPYRGHRTPKPDPIEPSSNLHTVASVRTGIMSAVDDRLFLDVTPCSLADRYQRIGRTWCLKLHSIYISSTLKMNTARSSETVIAIYHTTRHHVSDEPFKSSHLRLSLASCSFPFAKSHSDVIESS